MQYVNLLLNIDNLNALKKVVLKYSNVRIEGKIIHAKLKIHLVKIQSSSINIDLHIREVFANGAENLALFAH